MAAAGTTTGGIATSTWTQLKERKSKSKWGSGSHGAALKVRCSSSSSSVMDPYKTLRIRPGASEGEVKKAFRQLALRYHPDVCRGSNCRVEFQTINEAYDRVIEQLRSDCEETEDMEGELWEEWMGWEGAGIRDYSSHINPYI